MKICIIGVFFACLLALSEIEAATNCYQCTNCPEAFTVATSPSTACTSPADTCMKSLIKYPGGAMITRACVPSGSCKETSLGIAGVGFWISCCTTDNCNSATGMTPKIGALIAAILISMLAFLKF